MHNNIVMRKLFSAVVKNKVKTISTFEKTKNVQTNNIAEILSRAGNKHELTNKLKFYLLKYLMMFYSGQSFIRFFLNPPTKNALRNQSMKHILIQSEADLSCSQKLLFVTIIHVFHPLAISIKSPILNAMFSIYFSYLYCNISCILLLQHHESWLLFYSILSLIWNIYFGIISQIRKYRCLWD